MCYFLYVLTSRLTELKIVKLLHVAWLVAVDGEDRRWFWEDVAEHEHRAETYLWSSVHRSPHRDRRCLPMGRESRRKSRHVRHHWRFVFRETTKPIRCPRWIWQNRSVCCKLVLCSCLEDIRGISSRVAVDVVFISVVFVNVVIKGKGG